MKCPVCHIDMIVVEHKEIELDYCVKCSGVWFDSGELELLLDAVKGGGNLTGTGLACLEEPKCTERKKRCPICNREMKKVTMGEKPKVLVDDCPKGDGLWFDGGELEQIVTQVAKPPSWETGSQGILSFLGDVFKARHKADPKT